MPTQSPYRIELAKEQRAVLDERARAHTAPYWEVVRARIVLLASEGTSNKEVAVALVVCMRKLLSILDALVRDRATWRCPHALTP